MVILRFANRLLVFGLLVLAVPTFAQTSVAPCGITSIKATVAPQYPPIARAAHVSGMVIAMVQFSKDGKTSSARIVSGPEMLKIPALDYMRGLQANVYTGPRECPMVLSFELVIGKDACESTQVDVPYEQKDIQHAILRSGVVPLCDPGAEITRRKRFLIF